MKKRYTMKGITGFLREADAGLPGEELGRTHGFSVASQCACKAMYGGMKASEAQRQMALEAENTKSKKLLANDAQGRRDAQGAQGKVMAVAVRRDVVRQSQDPGLSERQALKLVGMSPSALRYGPRDDGNGRLRKRLTERAGQLRRHGYRMLTSRLRTDGWVINVKRTYRSYREEGRISHKRRRKILPVAERLPLGARYSRTRCGAWTSCLTN